jgi:hypothetical protein
MFPYYSQIKLFHIKSNQDQEKIRTLLIKLMWSWKFRQDFPKILRTRRIQRRYTHARPGASLWADGTYANYGIYVTWHDDVIPTRFPSIPAFAYYSRFRKNPLLF